MNVLWLRPTKGENISVRRERIAEELRKRNYEIDIRDASGLAVFGAIKQALTGNYDVIAGNVRAGLYIGYPLARILRTPFLGDVSDPISDIYYLPNPLVRFFEWYEWQILHRANAVVFVYESMYQEALRCGIDEAVKLPNAVDYEAFSHPDVDKVRQAGNILESEGVDLEKPVAIYIGFLAQHYYIEEILAAAKLTEEWEFVFVGEGPLDEMVKQAAELNENVAYPGSFEYRLMPGFLSHSSVGFCFKDAEQPLKIKEYGAAGLPIIVQPGELSKWYGDDELVFVYPEPTQISTVLERLVEDEAYRAQYVDAGQAIAREWNWEEIAEGYDELFKRIEKLPE